MTTEYSVGQIKRTLFATWRVERCDRGEVSFPFATGFGCGQTGKISQGYKHSLQTQVKSSVGLGLKLAGPIEVTASSSSEESVTIGYEFTNSQEWSYTAPPCEYCTPDIVFPDAVITVWSKRPLHLPLFVSKLTTFDPGSRSEIRGNCRKDPKRCHNCPDVVDGAPGTNPILSFPHARVISQIHHVVLAERSSSTNPSDLLDGMELSAAGQLFFVGLDRTLVSAAREVILLSIDDIDRALGTVRLYERATRLLFLIPESVANDSQPQFTITGDDLDHRVAPEFLKHPTLAALGVRLLELYIESPSGMSERRVATLSLKAGNMVHEWPITTFPRERTATVEMGNGTITEVRGFGKMTNRYETEENA
jgi:hypothetical protein